LILLVTDNNGISKVSGHESIQYTGGPKHFAPLLYALTLPNINRLSGLTLPLQKLEWLSYLILKTARSYLHSFWQNTGTWRTDGGTDTEKCFRYYTALHCKQCGSTRCKKTFI